jgi:bacterioferritin-associated ferredoxin
MYVCLCKGLKEADVVLATRACAERGNVVLEDVIEVLGLECEEACGYCVDNPEHIRDIVECEAETLSFDTSPAVSATA